MAKITVTTHVGERDYDATHWDVGERGLLNVYRDQLLVATTSDWYSVRLSETVVEPGEVALVR